MASPGFTAIQCWTETRELFNRLWKHEGGKMGLKKSAYLHRLLLAEADRLGLPRKQVAGKQETS